MRARTTDPFLAKFFENIPAEVAGSFDDAQLDAIKQVFGTRHWSSHAIDIRKSIPLIRRRIYVVFVAGREHRGRDRRRTEAALRSIRRFSQAAVIAAFLFMVLSSLAVLGYMGKRTLGIDVFPGIDMLPDEQIEKIIQ